ncbi:SspB family protein [Amaricoccus tamworthensis]|uniref:SspB family protein n=1 Tax=Amaricoccus tamworthensis TaxID=57002 RepID=UPI003C7D96F7
MADAINYGHLMQRALRQLIIDVLQQVSEEGLPGNHHFFITFDTTHPDVEIAPALFERYPEDMTIVLQEWFENLEVTPEKFTVTLNFGDQPEPLVIPFAAVKTFVDPSVEFGLRFDGHEKAAEEEELEAEEEEVEEEEHDAEIVSLDKFRKH